MAKNMGDSGTWGTPAEMAKFPNMYRDRTKEIAALKKPALTGIAKARSVGGKALAKGQSAMPKVKPVQADTLQSGGIDNAGEISQGLFKGQKSLSVRPTSTGYMRK